MMLVAGLSGESRLAMVLHKDTSPEKKNDEVIQPGGGAAWARKHGLMPVKKKAVPTRDI
jgi:hypothetical protein